MFKKLLNNLDKIIIFLLIVSCLYGIYEFISAIQDSSYAVKLVLKTYVPILIVFGIYLFYRHILWGTQLIVSIIFFFNYVLSMPKGFDAFHILYGQSHVIFLHGINFFRILSVFMSIVWISLMILPIVQFIYLKKNRIPPYN